MIMMMVSNIFFSLDDSHYSLQLLSLISFIKYGIRSLIITIYGSNRCTESQISTVLLNYKINSKENIWPNITHLLLLSFMYRMFTFVALLITKIDLGFEKQKNTVQTNVHADIYHLNILD